MSLVVDSISLTRRGWESLHSVLSYCCLFLYQFVLIIRIGTVSIHLRFHVSNYWLKTISDDFNLPFTLNFDLRKCFIKWLSLYLVYKILLWLNRIIHHMYSNRWYTTVGLIWQLQTMAPTVWTFFYRCVIVPKLHSVFFSCIIFLISLIKFASLLAN